MHRVSTFIIFALLTALPAHAALYNTGDIKAMNDIIGRNAMTAYWQQAPVDGSSVPANWKYFIVWSDAATDKRLIELTLTPMGNYEKARGVLNITTLPKLRRLNCDANYITAIDASNLKELETITCMQNLITSINVKGCSKLQSLYCAYNRLTSVDVSEQVALFGNSFSFEGYKQEVSLELSGSGGQYAGKAELGNEPIFDNPSAGVGYVAKTAASAAYFISSSASIKQVTFMANFSTKVYLNGVLNLTYTDPVFNPNDVAAVNALIDINKLSWPKANPACGAGVPDKWIYDVANAGNQGIVWSNAAKNKRIIEFRADYAGMTGELDATRLTEATLVSVSSNSLTGLIVKGLTGLESLYAESNRLTSLDLTGLTALRAYYCNKQSVYLAMKQNAGVYTSGVTMDPATTFGSNTLSYANGVLTGTDPSVTSAIYTCPAGLAGKTFSGTLVLRYGTFNDITQDFTDANFLNFLRQIFGKADGEPVYDTDTEAVANLNINALNIKSLAGLQHFTSLQQLSCYGNVLAELPELPGNVISLACNNNNLTSLPALSKDITYLQIRGNMFASLDLTAYDKLVTFNGSEQRVSLTVRGSGNLYAADVALHGATVFGNPAVSYAGGTLTCTNSAVTSVTFSAPTGLAGKTLSGTITFTYMETAVTIDGHAPTDAGWPAGAVWTGKNNTLKLASGVYGPVAINGANSRENAVIEVSGDVTVAANAARPDAVTCNGYLTVSGSGTLTATGHGNMSGNGGCGIFAGYRIATNTKTTATGGAGANLGGDGMYASDRIIVNAPTKGEGGAGSEGGRGINSGGTVFIYSQLVAFGGKGESGGFAIYAAKPEYLTVNSCAAVCFMKENAELIVKENLDDPNSGTRPLDNSNLYFISHGSQTDFYDLNFVVNDGIWSWTNGGTRIEVNDYYDSVTDTYVAWLATVGRRVGPASIMLAKAGNTYPNLTAGEVVRSGSKAATVKFSCATAGTYYWQLDDEPATSAALYLEHAHEAAMAAGENTLTFANLTPGPHTVYITARAANGRLCYYILPMDIPAPAGAPTITTAAPLANGMAGTAYSQPLAATGAAPITWSVSVGALPAGLALNATTGAITGTPAANGTSVFTVRATNSVEYNEKQFSIKIIADITAKFTDANFLAAVRTALSKGATDPVYDVDVAEVTTLGVKSKGIASLAGLEYFTALTWFECNDNLLTALPELPPVLKNFNCSNNQLAALPALPATLETIDCGNNLLTALPEPLPNLTILYCNNNLLTELPALSPALTRLYCYNNLLTALPALPQGLLYLHFQNNRLTALPALPTTLTRFDCSNNRLTSLNLSGLNSLTSYAGANQEVSLTLKGRESSYITAASMNSETAFGNAALSCTGTVLKSTSTAATSSTFTAPTGASGKSLSGTLTLAYQSSTDITDDFTDPNFLAAVRTALSKGASDRIYDIDVEMVTTLNVPDKGIASLAGLQHFVALTWFACNNNLLTVLSGLPPVLKNFNCSYNRLTALPALPVTLETIDCGNNRIAALPKSLPNLTILYCNNNLLTELPALPAALTRLYCYNNQLTALPELPKGLYYLHFQNNLLTALPALPNSLIRFDCSNNRLTSLNLSGLTSLTGFYGADQAVSLVLTGSGSNYTVAVSMNSATTFGNVALSYTGGTLKSTSAAAASSTFASPTGLSDKTLSGTLTLTYSTTPVLGGTVTVSGTATFGSTLTAVTTGLTATPAADPGALSYQWKRGAANIGANSATYTTVAADIGTTLTVTVSASNCTGSVTSAATATIGKAAQTAPAAPTLASKTSTSVTLNAIAGAEYSRNNGSAWQDGTTFSGLTANTAYTFIARMKATATHNASANSAGLNVTTGDDGTATAPVITTTSLPAGTVGVPYSATLAATGTAPITWETVLGSAGLPAGLSLDNSTGVISGTPTQVQTANISVIARNAAGTGTKTLSIEIKAGLTGIGDDMQAETFKAYVKDGLLHVSGLVAGKLWAVYGVSGVLIYQSTATGSEADIRLPVQGVYIVKSDGKTVKAVYH